VCRFSSAPLGRGGTNVNVVPNRLPKHPDEQAFRFNERQDKDARQCRMASGAIAVKRLAYRPFTGKVDTEYHQRREE
jgi:hypothetical protein